MIKPTIPLKYDGVANYTLEANYFLICGLSQHLGLMAQSMPDDFHRYRLTFSRNNYLKVVTYLNANGYHCLVM